ncbi:unnamed protein product, partial [Pocillopora meandrina]
NTSSKYNHDTLAVQLVLKTNYVLQFDIDLITDEDIMLNPKRQCIDVLIVIGVNIAELRGPNHFMQVASITFVNRQDLHS